MTERLKKIPDESWKTADQIWSNGSYYKFYKIMEKVCQEQWKDKEGNLLVQRFRPKRGAVSYYMKDTPESLSALHGKMMILAIFAPEYFGDDLDLRKTSKSFTTYLRKKGLDLSVECPKDWDRAREAWIKAAKEKNPQCSDAEGLWFFIRDCVGIDFPEEVVKTWFPKDPEVVASCNDHPELREKKSQDRN